MNGSFAPFFGVGADFQQANLNQPFRFGNVTTAEVESLVNTSNLNLAALASPSVQSLINAYGLTEYIAGLVPQISRVEYVNGYLANSNVNSNQFLFFLPGYFDIMLLYAGELTKQPVTVGELLTLTSLPMMNAYAGPVLVLTGCEWSRINTLTHFANRYGSKWLALLRRRLPYHGWSRGSIHPIDRGKEFPQRRRWQLRNLHPTQHWPRHQLSLQCNRCLWCDLEFPWVQRLVVSKFSRLKAYKFYACVHHWISIWRL